ncbi:hypothetical protein ACOTVS_10155 [Aliarcobacter butzleri]
MKKSIFNIGIKDIAKLLVKTTDKNITLTEALNILAKMDGFTSYNKECREYVNYENTIKEKLQTEIEKISILWEDLRTNRSIEKEHEYITKLINIIESFFVFKDNSKILIKNIPEESFPVNLENYCIFKKLLDINSKYLSSNYLPMEPYEIEEEKIYKTLEDGIFQKILYVLSNNMSFKDFLFKKHPSKVIDWFKKYFELEYSGYSNNKNSSNTLVNSFSSNISVNIKTSYEEQLNSYKDIEQYLIDIDYEIPEHEIKIRLSYNLTKTELDEIILDSLFLENENNIIDYLENEFTEQTSNLNNEIFSKYGNNNYFAIGLEGVQFAKIRENFETQISCYNKNEDEEDFDKFLEYSNITESLLNPVNAYNTCVNELTKNILSKQFLSKISFIEKYIKNNPKLDRLEYKFNCVDEFEFNVNRDITFATYKYVFEALNFELVHIMNSSFIKVLIDIIINTQEKKTSLLIKLNDIIKDLNSMNISDANVIVSKLRKQFVEDRDLKSIIEFKKDNIQDLSGLNHEIMLTKNKQDFIYLMLNYLKEKKCFECYLEEIKYTISE